MHTFQNKIDTYWQGFLLNVFLNIATIRCINQQEITKIHELVNNRKYMNFTSDSITFSNTPWESTIDLSIALISQENIILLENNIWVAFSGLSILFREELKHSTYWLQVKDTTWVNLLWIIRNCVAHDSQFKLQFPDNFWRYNQKPFIYKMRNGKNITLRQSDEWKLLWKNELGSIYLLALDLYLNIKTLSNNESV
jgi:hypothetical protein